MPHIYNEFTPLIPHQTEEQERKKTQKSVGMPHQSAKKEARKFHDLPLGVPATALTEQGDLPQVHQMDQSGERNLQTSRFQGRLQTVGSTQK